MKIPKRFKLMGATIEVKEDPTLMFDRNWHGSADFSRGEISLQPINAAFPVSATTREQTFLHELVHHIAFHAGAAVNHELKQNLHKNEDFTDLFSALLHQALTTMEYEEEKQA